MSLVLANSIVYFVNSYKNKIAVALAFVLIKKARQVGQPVIDFTKRVQDEYFTEIQDSVSFSQKDIYLTYAQESVINKLHQIKGAKIHKISKGCSSISTGKYIEGSSDGLDCGKSTVPTPLHPKSGILEKSYGSVPRKEYERLKPQRLFSHEHSALKNLEFIRSILDLNDAIEQNSPAKTSFSLLYDEGEYRSQSLYKPSQENLEHKKLTEDSGLGHSEVSEDDKDVNFVSGEEVREALQTSDINRLLVNSLTFVIDIVEREIQLKPEEVFNNWRGSLTEYACEILKECSCYYTSCRDLVVNLVLMLLDDIWDDNRLAQNQQWELKTHILNQFITHIGISYEILHYIHDKIHYFAKSVERRLDVSLMAEKLVLLLNLYCSVCHTLLKLRSASGDATVDTSEDCDVTMLWQKKWGSQSGNLGEKKIIRVVEESELSVMDKFVFVVFTRYPLLWTLAQDALKMANEMNCIDISSFKNGVSLV